MMRTYTTKHKLTAELAASVTPNAQLHTSRNRMGAVSYTVYTNTIQPINTEKDSTPNCRKQLWCVVLMQALADIHTPEENMPWFYTEDCKEICDMVGILWHAIKVAAERMKADKNDKEIRTAVKTYLSTAGGYATNKFDEDLIYAL